MISDNAYKMKISSFEKSYFSPLFNGDSRKKFEEMLRILEVSLEQGSWLPRKKAVVENFLAKGSPYQKNLLPRLIQRETPEALAFLALVRKGVVPKEKFSSILEMIDNRFGEHTKLTIWLNVCVSFGEAISYLDQCRPATKYLGPKKLSDKVLKTLKLANLDMDMDTIRMPNLELLTSISKTDDGVKISPEYRMNWSPGVVHGTSRFASSHRCEACNKPIPSNTFVPLEGFDKKSGLNISLIVGVDCAFNIYGVKDVGFDRAMIPGLSDGESQDEAAG